MPEKIIVENAITELLAQMLSKASEHKIAKRTFGERRTIARIVASRITGTVSVKPDCWSSWSA